MKIIKDILKYLLFIVLIPILGIVIKSIYTFGTIIGTITRINS